MIKTTLEEEINIWLIFWCGTALIFVVFWCIANLKTNTDNKKGVKANKNINTDKKTTL